MKYIPGFEQHYSATKEGKIYSHKSAIWKISKGLTWKHLTGR